MPIFLTVPLSTPPAELAQAVEKYLTPHQYYKLEGGHGWLIQFQGTTVELSNILNITGNQYGEKNLTSVLVTLVSSYYGRAPVDMWEWIQTRMEQQ